MYEPAPFLISTAALTSIFSFFFGGYFRERERAYRLWIKYMAYGADVESGEENKDICAELESKERVFRQAKGLLKILLFTLLGEFAVFQFYSLKYIYSNSSYYRPDAFHTYIWFTAIIGGIVLINCFEMVYIRVALSRMSRFSFFRLKRRVTGQETGWRHYGPHSTAATTKKRSSTPTGFRIFSMTNRGRATGPLTTGRI